MIKRDIAVDILENARYFPAVAILGPRQSGKTTLAQELFKKHIYVSLEDIDIRASALKDPRSFLLTNRSEYGMIIDEFQYAPDLLSYIQTIVDKEKKMGFFVLTGSQNFLMNKAITQSLAGRVSIHTLLPLAVPELIRADLLPLEIEDMLYKGNYPAVYSQKVSPISLYKNYVQTYLERDVRQLEHVGDLAVFQTFLKLCAGRVGQLLNLTSLGNECNISDHTVNRWLSILEASYIVFRLYPYHKNFGKRLVKTPKIYFYDAGLVCYLLGIKEQAELATHPFKGNIFESFVISEVLKQYYNQGQIPNVYFWRDKTEHEIDCIIEAGQTLIPVEIKAGRTPNARFFDGIDFWKKLAEGADNQIRKKNPGYVVFGGSSKQTVGYANLISWQSMQEIFKL